MATSYISEHSAEYYLVPALKRILDSEFEFVAPVFPWLSREFSKVSSSIHLDDKFHVLVMFPRRPKVTGNNRQVFVTINEELEDFNSVGMNMVSQLSLDAPMLLVYGNWQVAVTLYG